MSFRCYVSSRNIWHLTFKTQVSAHVRNIVYFDYFVYNNPLEQKTWIKCNVNKSDDFRVTHQATADSCSNYPHTWVSVLTDERTDTCVKIMTTYSALALVGQQDRCVINYPLCQTHSLACNKHCLVFTWNLFCFARFRKVGTDVRTDNMCESNDQYLSWLWVGLVDQFYAISWAFIASETCL